nr:cytochrome p450 monooxygenase 1 [Quercus suber]POE94743.1 cytochrome p450 monooxygenase 1 [Quercus suber]
MSSRNFENPWEFQPERWLQTDPIDDLEASQPFSLGWMELQTIMAKLIYRYDLKLANDDLDWHRDSKMHTLWEKPALMVTLKVIHRDSVPWSDSCVRNYRVLDEGVTTILYHSSNESDIL